MAGPDAPYPTLLVVAAAPAAVAAAPVSANHLTGEPAPPQSRCGAPGGFDTPGWANGIAIHKTSNRTYAVVTGDGGVRAADITDTAPAPSGQRT